MLGAVGTNTADAVERTPDALDSAVLPVGMLLVANELCAAAVVRRSDAVVVEQAAGLRRRNNANANVLAGVL